MSGEVIITVDPWDLNADDPEVGRIQKLNLGQVVRSTYCVGASPMELSWQVKRKPLVASTLSCIDLL